MAKSIITRENAERDEREFYKVWEAESRHFKYLEIAEAVGYRGNHAHSYVSKKAKDKRFTAEQRKAVLALFWRRQDEGDPHTNAIAKLPDAFHYALTQFFNIPRTTLENAQSALPGVYELWRQSVEDKDFYIRGKLTISFCADTGALNVTVLQRRKPQEGTEGDEEEFEGFATRQGDVYWMFLKHAVTNCPRIAMFPFVRRSNVKRASKPSASAAQITELDGMAMGIDGGKKYDTAVILTRLRPGQEKSIDDKLDVIVHDRVPPQILARLKKHPIRRW
jgi:hypothetical protein